MNAKIDYTCPDCALSVAREVGWGFLVGHHPTCPVLASEKLTWLADQDIYSAATLVEECRGLVGDYGSAEVHHVPLTNGI